MTHEQEESSVIEKLNKASQIINNIEYWSIRVLQSILGYMRLGIS